MGWRMNGIVQAARDLQMRNGIGDAVSAAETTTWDRMTKLLKITCQVNIDARHRHRYMYLQTIPCIKQIATGASYFGNGSLQQLLCHHFSTNKCRCNGGDCGRMKMSRRFTRHTNKQCHAHTNHSVGDTCIQYHQYIIFTCSSVLQLGTAALLQVLRSLVEVLDQLSDGEIKHNLLEDSMVSSRRLTKRDEAQLTSSDPPGILAANTSR